MKANGREGAILLADRITADPAVMVGEPVVRGTRIPVERVLEQMAYNPDLGELFAMYPHLTIEDVKACLAFAQKAVAKDGKRLRTHASRAGRA
jgi:uncharacterized protein (DUF433 family)